MAEVKDIRKAVLYLAGYLGSGDKFVRSWCSQGWVFRSWIGWSKWYRWNFSRGREYPSAEALVSLSLMSPCEREQKATMGLMRRDMARRV